MGEVDVTDEVGGAGVLLELGEFNVHTILLCAIQVEYGAGNEDMRPPVCVLPHSGKCRGQEQKRWYGKEN